ncbi:MAG: alpha-D-glucose phosphate-specific phosphoglucomutase, partial [Planctomycetes bacterium]|nr:alpha-D-glucose phosphate-specific phosphoglucomutase [Planctomycetota bacterium]
MAVHPLAGKPAPIEILENISRLVSDYYTLHPDLNIADQKVAFGTSGHRGSSAKSSFNEDHLLAICQAISEYRQKQAYDGPLFLGMDTHALSEAAMSTALEVFAANDVQVRYQQDRGWTPTPVISHAILCYNRDRKDHFADGVIITPSHNPPSDGGIKYNPPHGGPASGEVTSIIEARANAILQDDLRAVKRLSLSSAMSRKNIQAIDFIVPYVVDLENVIDMKAIHQAKLHIGVDPLGGSGIRFWQPMAERYQLDIELVNQKVDPTFSFMCVDKDGKIRMDCSSPYAMAGLIGLKDRYDIAFGNDPDYDRHGIVTRSSGLLNPNHYLAVA